MVNIKRVFKTKQNATSAVVCSWRLNNYLVLRSLYDARPHVLLSFDNKIKRFAHFSLEHAFTVRHF